jgi:phage-related protein
MLPEIVQRIVLETNTDQAISNLRRGLDDIATSSTRASDSTDDLGRSIRTAGSEAGTTSRTVDNATASVSRNTSATDSNTRSQDRAASATRDHARARETHTRALDADERAMLRWIAKAEDASAAARLQHSILGDNERAHLSLTRAIDRFIDRSQLSAVAMSVLGDAIGALKLPALASAIGPVTSAIASLGTTLIAATGAMSQMFGVALALPGALAAIGTAAIGAFVGFRGIGDAVKAVGAATGGGGGGGRSAAQEAMDEERAMRRVEQATRDLAAAKADRAAQDAEDARRTIEWLGRVEDAETQLRDAQRVATQIQEGLTEARRMAGEELEDLAFRATGAALSEERAVLRLQDARDNAGAAQARLAALEASGTATAEELAAARRAVIDSDLDLREAELNLAEAQDRNQDSTLALNEANAAGLDGTRTMTDYQRRAQQAARDVADAQENLADIQAEGIEIQREHNQNVIDGEQAIKDAEFALREATFAFEQLGEKAGGSGGGIDKAKEALDKLSPSARAFVERWGELKEAFTPVRTDAQEALFAPLLGAFDSIVRLAAPARDILVDVNTALGNFLATFAQRITTPQFIEDLRELSGNNAGFVTALGDGIMNLVDAFVGLGVAAGPTLERIGESIRTGTGHLRDMINAGRESGELEAFLDRAYDRFQQVWQIVKDLGMGLFNIFSAATPMGNELMGTMAEMVARFREWTGSAEGQNRIVAYFNDLRPVASEIVGLVGDIARAFGRLSSEGAPGATTIIQRLRTEFLPLLIEIVDGLSDPEFVDNIMDIGLAIGEGFKNISVGPLKTYSSIIAEIAKTVAWLIEEIPGFGTFIGLAGTMALAGKAASQFSTGISTVGRAFDAFSAGGSLANSLAQFRAWHAGIISLEGTSAATRALAGLSRGFDALKAAMVGHPMIAIGVAVIALGVALWQLYKHNEAFRNFVDSTFVRLKEVAQDVWRAVKPILESIGEFVTGTVVPAFQAFGRAVAQMWTNAQPALRAVAAIFADVIVPAIADFVGWIRDNFPPVGDLFRAVFGRVVDTVRLAAATLDTAWTLIVDGINILRPAASAIGDIFRAALDIAIGVIRRFVEFVGDVWPSIADIIGVVLDVVTDVIGTALGFIEDVWSRWGDNLLEIIDAVWDYIRRGVEAAMRVISGIIEVITGIISGDWRRVWEGIRDIFGGVWDQIRNVASTATRLLGEVLQMGWDLIVAGITAFLDLVVDFFTALPGRIVTVVSAIGNIVWEATQAGWDFFRNSLSTFIDAVIDFFTRLPGRVVATLGNIGQFIWDAVTGGFDLLRRSIGGVLDDVVDFFTKLPERVWRGLGNIGLYIWDHAKSGFDTLKTEIGNVASHAVDVFTKLPGQMWDGFSRGMSAIADIGRNIVSKLIEGIGAAPGAALNLAKNIANALIDVVNSQIINRINRAVEFTIPVPFAPDIPFNPPDIQNIPHMAKGAVVDRPTLALIGEAAASVPEIVTPERLMRSVFAEEMAKVLAEQAKANRADDRRPGGPAVQIEEANFYDQADLDLLMRRSEFALAARRF